MNIHSSAQTADHEIPATGEHFALGPGGNMVPRGNGPWIRAEDYDQLAARLRILDAALALIDRKNRHGVNRTAGPFAVIAFHALKRCGAPIRPALLAPGIAVALAEVMRMTDDPQLIVNIMQGFALSLDDLVAAGTDEYDLEVLRPCYGGTTP